MMSTTGSPPPSLASTAAQPKARFNAVADGKYKKDNLFIGVKEALAFQPGHQAERRIRFPIAGIDQPAELLFSNNYPNITQLLSYRGLQVDRNYRCLDFGLASR